MILLIDAGNSRLKWWLARPATGAVVARGNRSWPDWRADLAAWLAHAPGQALISCVAGPERAAALRAELAERVPELRWLVAEADAHGLRNRYQPPASLGADRYAALVAALHRRLGDCLVVGVGTALTADMLTGDGEFLGGCIVPGPYLMRSALATGTAGVAPIMASGAIFPRDTGEAVATGIGLALAGVVLGLRERLIRLRGAAPAIVVAGGARAPVLAVLAENGVDVVEVEDLVLEGLARIAGVPACAD